MKKALIAIAMVIGHFAIAQNDAPRPIQNQVHSQFINLTTSQQGLSPQQIFNEVYQLSADDKLNLVSELQDDLGQMHKKYQQFCKDVPVQGALVTLHYQDNAPTMLSGYFAEVSQVSVTAQLQGKSALKNAKTKVGAKQYAWEAGHSLHLDMDEPKGNWWFTLITKVFLQLNWPTSLTSMH